MWRFQYPDVNIGEDDYDDDDDDYHDDNDYDEKGHSKVSNDISTDTCRSRLIMVVAKWGFTGK